MQPSRILAVDDHNRPQAARLMARLKPDWWDEPSALEQLRGGQAWLQLAETAGQGIEPAGWLLAKAYPAYRSAEIETIGGMSDGEMQVGPGLEELVAACGCWARAKELGSLRFVMGSRGTSIHGRPLPAPWLALRDLRASGRPELGWWTGLGFVTSGLLPNAYGPGCHGILLVKLLE